MTPSAPSHVEEQRARHRNLPRSNRLERGNDARNRGDLELVGVLLVERETEHADAVLVRLDAGERLGVVAVDIDCDAVLADLDAGLSAAFFLASSSLPSALASWSLSAPAALQPACRNFLSKTSRVPCFSPGCRLRSASRGAPGSHPSRSWQCWRQARRPSALRRRARGRGPSARASIRRPRQSTANTMPS